MRSAALRMFCVLVVILLLAAPAFAGAAAFNPMTQELAALNRIDPLQDPKYEHAAEVLKRRMLDRKNRVVGSVRDIVLNDNGGISYLDVDFDRMKLGRPVFVSYSTFQVDTVSNGYAMSFDSKEIEEIYPTLLAGIETAAGEDDLYSLKKMKGLEVWTESGRRIGNVSDVLFGSGGQRAELLYVTLSSGNLRGKGIGIPFGQAEYEKSITERRVTVSDDLAVAMTGFVKAEN